VSFKQEPLIIKIYVLAVIGTGLLFLLFNIPVWSHLGISFLYFVFLHICMENLSVPLPGGQGFVSVSFVTSLAMIILFGPVAAAWGSFAIFLDIRALKQFKEKYHRIFFNAAQVALSTGIAGYIYQYAGGIPGQFSMPSDIGPVLASVVTYLILNSVFVITVISLSQKMSFFGVWLTNFRWSVPNYIAISPLGILIAAVYVNIGISGVLLLIIPLMLARHTFILYMDMRNQYLSTIKALTKAIDAKDHYTHGHSERVAEYAVLIGKELKLQEDFLEKLEYIALMHDIGKIGIPESILNKPSRLSDDEFSVVREHSAVGAEIISNIKFIGDHADIVRHHHERVDGRGYPDGLSGEKVSMGAKIVGVADAFDAMTTERVYRSPMTKQQAMVELQSCCNSQFCGEVVSAFEKVLRRRGEIE